MFLTSSSMSGPLSKICFADPGVVAGVLGHAFADGFAEVHDLDAFAHAHDYPHLVFDEQDSQVELVAEPVDHFHQFVCLLSLIHISEPTRRTPISYAVF